MLQKISKSSFKCEMWTISTEGVEIFHNVYNLDGVYNKNFPTFFKAFHSVHFLLTNSQLVHSLVLFTVLSGWVDFIVQITPREQFWQVYKGLVYKGLDIKFAQCWLVQHIGHDFLYTARFSVNLSFPFHFWEKSKKLP